MFKVICIDASKGKVYGIIPKFKEGEILDAQRTNQTGYLLIHKHPINEASGNRVYWCEKRFIPLSNIDETELLKERQHETCKI